MPVEEAGTKMAILRHRRDRIERIERRIMRLSAKASGLLEKERTLEARLEGGLKRRPQERSRRRLERIQARRTQLVEGELRNIMVALEDQSRRTRVQLDRELARLAPIEEEWERLRATFDALDDVVHAPALEQLAGQLTGSLQIPEFPVREHEGYLKPFPHGAVVF